MYRADDLKLGRPVALKFLPEGLEPLRPIWIDWDTLVSQRMAVAWALQAPLGGALLAVLNAFIVVGARVLLRQPWSWPWRAGASGPTR